MCVLLKFYTDFSFNHVCAGKLVVQKSISEIY